MKVLRLLVASVIVLAFEAALSAAQTKKAKVQINRDYKHPHGEAKTLISFPDNKPLVVYEEEIKSLLHEDLGDFKIAVYPIVGGFRMGKSFFLDYCLRYLYANYKSFNYKSNPLTNAQHWAGDENEPLKGFSWRPGTAGNTAGIVIWSDIFYYEEPNGEKVAIILMDTQGMFDTKEKMETSNRIFILNSLFASSLIFLNNGNLKEDAVNFLGMVTEYAKLVHKMSSEGGNELQEKPFQDLLFLFRNWPFPEDHGYGLQGGTEYIIEELKVRDDAEESAQQIRETIVDTYERIHGYLLPYPGNIVAGKGDYLGHWGGMSDEFREQYFTLIEWLFRRENIVKKRVLGRELTGAEYYAYIKAYCDIYKSEEFPKSPDLYNVTVDRQNKILVDEAFLIYANTMREYESLNVTVEGSDLNATFAEIHERNKLLAVEHFQSKPKLGTKELEASYEKLLREKLDKYFSEWSARVIMYYTSFVDLERKANETIANLMVEKEKELNGIIEKHNETIGEMSDSIKIVTQQLEHDKRESENREREQREKLKEVENQLTSSIDAQGKKIDEEKRRFDNEISQMNAQRVAEEERRREGARRAEADRRINEEFQRKIEEMRASNKADSEAYKAAIREHEEKVKKEKEDRERQDLLHKEDMEKIKREHQATEERLQRKLKVDTEAYERQKNEIALQIEESKRKHKALWDNFIEEQQRLSQQIIEMTRRNNDALDSLQEREFAEIRRLKDEFRRRQEEERRFREAELARIQANVRRSGAASCVPNERFIYSVFALLSALIIAKML